MLNLCLQSSAKQNLYPIAERLEPKFCLLKIGINCCQSSWDGSDWAARKTMCRAVSGFFCAIMVADIDLPAVGRDI